MSHSVFRDLDEDKSSGNGSNGDVADNNLIVFIDKDDAVKVDPNALQDFIVNANTDTKSTVSVIRVGSPTPSMETDGDESSAKPSDDDNDNRSDDDEQSKSSDDDSNEQSDEDGDTDKSQKSKKKKKKNKMPGYGLTVEDFYNPQQAIQFATEIMNIAGITNPKQLKADYEHLRYIIANDHCYTPFTYTDLLNEGKSDETAESAKRDAKNKSKLPTTSAQSANTTKKNARNSISSKSQPSNGLDKETSNSARNRSVDDANSSTENTAERSSDEEEAESETDFSDMTVSESDNDRDSDLDFSVNDLHSKRGKKIKKRKIRAKKLALKKRRRSTIDFTGSDDGSTLNRKKTTKLPKKTLNTSAKSANTSASNVSTTAKSPAVSSSSVKSPAVPSTVKSPAVPTTMKSPPASTSTPRITKVTYIKETPQNTSHENSPKLPTTQKESAQKLPTVQKANSTTNTPNAATSTENKSKIIIMKHKEKKTQSGNILPGDASSLFTPDVIRKNPTEATTSAGKNPVSTPPPAKVETVSKTLTPISVQSITSQSTPRMNTTTKLVKAPMVTYVRKLPKPTMNLAFEQDKQLDLIDSLVQEELSKTETDATTSSTSETIIPAAIPNIVKMLETSSESSPPIHSTELSTLTTSSSNTMPITYTTTASVHDSQMLPDDLLESFVNSDILSDDLMQHVAKLVEDKNLQEVLDQSIGSMSSCTTPMPPLHTVTSVQKPNLVQTTPTITKVTEEPKTPVNIMKLAATPGTLTPGALTPITRGEPIKVKRSDGRIITLPPIEAPTTRGAKRRAEITPGSDAQPKQKVFTIIVHQTESPSTPKNVAGSPTIQSPKAFSASASKAKPILPRERRASVAAKRASIDAKPKMGRSMSISNPPPNINNADEDDEDGSDGGSYNSEDDPHRLWCICRQPHNNRFMICCDKCEDWFHGKCVGITRQMGQEMEKRQTDWICPKCLQKQQPSIKNIFPRKSPLDHPSIRMREAGSSPQSTSDSMVANCIVCGIKPSRVSSVYCSDDCIRRHASKTVSSSGSNANESEATTTTSPSMKSPTDGGERKTFQPKIINQLFKDKANHVVLFDKSTGKYLTGKNAPTTDKLQQWLAEHPNHEVLKPGTPQAVAFKAKQQQLKALAKNMDAERELFAVTQPVKIQTKLRFDSDKMVYVNPSTQKPATTTALKRPISATSSSPVNTKSPVLKVEPITKTPKLTSTPVQKIQIVQKKRMSDVKTPTQTKPESSSSSSSSSSKPNDRDRLRISARNSLIEQLISRTKEINDANAPRLTEAEITEFVTGAEKEMFDMFGGDTNVKYKAKYRSLMYNIKDRKNLTLFEKISSKMIEPKQLVRMSTEELASQELAKWRENENKHQLEMITKSELDQLACGNSYVLKTHKGEEVIQDSERINLDKSIPVEDVVSVLNSSTVSSSDATTITKDSRFEKYFSPDGKSSYSGSGKKDSERSHEKKDRHESRSGSSSSKHKRKRSRERHSSHSHSSHSSHKDRERSHDKDRKERSSVSDSRKDKKDHKSSSSNSSSSSSRSKPVPDKDRKRESTSKIHSTPKVPKTDENSIIDKILKAQSTIDSILHPEEHKKITDTSSTANVSSGSVSESTALARLPSVANESDQEPTSTVTIPSPPELTPELRSTTPPPVEKAASNIIWTGNINMIDVATFQVSLSPMSGSLAMIDFPKEFDVVGRISPDTVWDYLEKIRISKDIVLVRFRPRSTSDDDETAYSTFISYLDTRQRLGVIKIPSKMVKDFYIMPLTSHRSLPSILKSTTGFDLGADRPDLLLGIIVRNRMSQSSTVHAPSKYRQQIPFIGHKPVVNAPAKDAHYTPPSSPNISQTQSIAKPPIKSFSSNLDDDEPYSPGGSDEDDLSLNPISTSYLSSSTVNSVPDYAKPLTGTSTMSKFEMEKLEELNRQIEAEKKEIAMHLRTVDIDEPYSPTSSVSPPLNTNLSDVVSNISIPANLADILKNVASFASTTTHMSMNQYTSAMMDTSDNEYVPAPSVASSSMTYAPVPTQLIQPAMSAASQPSKLAQLTDEELLRLVPDEID